MYLNEVVSAGSGPQLSHGFNERCAFDIADCTSKFNYANIRLFIGIIDGNLCDSFDPILNSIRKVRNDLYSLTKIISSSLSFYYVSVDLSSCDITFSSQCDVQVSLVVSKIEINFAAVIEDKAFAMSEECQVIQVVGESIIETNSVGAIVPASTFI